MKKTIIILSCCTAMLFAGYVAYRGYRVWRREHLISMARAFIAKTDGRNALLCLRQILGSSPRNVEATRLMADLATAGRSPDALLWRSKVVELNPRSAEDRLALAQTALTFRDYAMATNALAGVLEAERESSEYQNVAGAAAIAVGLPAEAEEHFLRASRLAPADPVPQMNLEILRLSGTNTPVVESARAALNRFTSTTTNGLLRCQALRELIAHAGRFQQTNAALSMSDALIRDTNSVFADRLLRLNVLKVAQSPEFDASLGQFQREAADDPARIYEMATWESTKLANPAGSLAWLRSLSPNLQSNLTVMVSTADSYSLLKDWGGLQSSVEKQNWHELEFVRLAMKTRALRGQDLSDAAKIEWAQAVRAANSKSALAMLLRLAAQWKWEGEAEDLLWAIVNRYPTETWAVQSLKRVLYVGGQTRLLMMLFSKEVKSSPSDLDAKNNLAAAALLLQANELKPHDLAKEVYQSAPTNASYASTYAFSLYLQKKNSEALKIMEQLTPQQLEKPSLAGYYGLILSASGNAPKARPYLHLASKALLLPEERKLFAKANSGA